MGCCDAGLATGGAAGVPATTGAGPAGATGGLDCPGACVTGADGGCRGGVTITAAGAVFSTGCVFTVSTECAGGVLAGGMTAETCSCGSGGSATATLGATTTGLSCTTGGAAATGAGLGGAATDEGGAVADEGRGGTGGCCCCSSFSFSSLSTSPGLEILDRSSFGLISPGAVLSLEATELDLVVKYLLIFSASSTSTELECVFFSVTPTSNKTSRIALLFTSSSLARSLIRIFVIRSAFPPSIRYAIIMTSRLPLFFYRAHHNS